MKRHQPPTRGQQEAPLVWELPPWGSETHRVLLIEGVVSRHPRKGSRATRLISYRSQKLRARGRAMSQRGQFSSPGHRSRRRQGSKHLLLWTLFYLAHFDLAYIWNSFFCVLGKILAKICFFPSGYLVDSASTTEKVLSSPKHSNVTSVVYQMTAHVGTLSECSSSIDLFIYLCANTMLSCIINPAMW